MRSYTPDGKFVDVYATGLRNSAGLDWRADGTLYATDNGRDLLGDDFPPCELNEIRQGGFYGWPFANGDRVPDPDFGAGREAVIAASIPPAFGFRPHNAPLGIVFLRSDKQLPEYRGDAIVALHGSWNRSHKDGYKVVALHWDADGTIRSRDFLTGFLKDENVIGRPAEVAEDADGAIYVSDDYANAVYRIVPGGNQTLDIGQAAKTSGATTRQRPGRRKADCARRNRVRPTRVPGMSCARAATARTAASYSPASRRVTIRRASRAISRNPGRRCRRSRTRRCGRRSPRSCCSDRSAPGNDRCYRRTGDGMNGRDE